MAIRLEDKKQIVSEVNEAATSALSAVIADYRGVTVSDLTELRKTARKNNVYLRVVRNTLLKKAVENTTFECMSEALVGPTILAFSMEDPGAAARVLKDFAKGNDKFEIKALSIGGKFRCRSTRCNGKSTDLRSGGIYAHECHARTDYETGKNIQRGSY